jgi:hypothetical protein
MFDYINTKRDPITIIFYTVGAPFGLAWALHQSLITGFALQFYLMTCIAFVLQPFEFRQKEVKQRWYWKIILCFGALIHPAFLVGLWFLDASHPTFVTGTATVIFMGFAIGTVEMIILDQIVDYYRPEGPSYPSEEDHKAN